MQIKRFEAADMTDALRMVKRELGDHAVILSAKAVRPGGFFSAMRQKRVEITAAADHHADESAEETEAADEAFSGLLAEQLESESSKDHVSLTSPPQVIEPMVWPTQEPIRETPADHQREKPTGGGRTTSPRKSPSGPLAAHGSVTIRGLGDAPTTTVDKPFADDHARIADPFYRDADQKKVIALVGPHGAGKTTTLVKLAWHCQIVENKGVGMISLDRFRMAANAMLEKVAAIMNLPLFVVHDTDQLQSALTDLAGFDVVLIDTPGMSNTAGVMMADIGHLLQSAAPDETHLVVNATVRDDVLTDAVRSFLSIGADHVLFSHMDEVRRDTNLSVLLSAHDLPCAFYGDGVDLFDHLQEMTREKLDRYGSADEPVRERVTVLSPRHQRVQPAGLKDGDRGDDTGYLANRNSDVFHQPTCRSAKRINVANIATFDSLEQAIQAGFKPCRACCDTDMIKATVAALLGHQRVRAI